MIVFDTILIFLAAVLLSNLINRFIPVLSVPMIQIVLGASLTLIPHESFGLETYLPPELFFVLFLSPLIFHSTRTADLQNLRKMIKPIVLAAVGLVVFAVFVIGFFVNRLFPAIPLAAAFALAAALGPTDVVAVESIAHRIKMPKRVQGILTGESIINDATGIVCFQFAIVAAATGTFNVLRGVGQFFFLALGGLLVGTLTTISIFILIRWLRSLHIVTTSLYLSIGILSPFIIYMIAEELGTSGILAVFSSGILHALYKDKLNPEVISINNATENVWNFLAFSLEGLVFVILGAHLPNILRVETGWASGLGGRQILLYVILIYLALATARFFWWVVTVRRKTYNDPENPIGVIRSGLIFSIGGARGALSMAIVLSIPLLLSSGDLFPERDLIILITCGIIAVSLFMTNFGLPILVPKTKKLDVGFSETEREAQKEILETVIERLKEAMTAETLTATEIVIHHYHVRLNKRFKSDQSFSLRTGILLLEKDVILHMAEMGQLSGKRAGHYLKEMNRLHDESNNRVGPIQSFSWFFRHLYSSLTWKEAKPRRRDIRLMKEKNAKLMKKKQRELHLSKNDPALKVIASEHEKVMSARMGFSSKPSDNMAHIVNEVAESGLYIERILIQQMMESGRLSRKTAKEMQGNIILLEAQLHSSTSL